MEILAIIPARGGSKGIPMKNIVKLNGKPLLQYSWSRGVIWRFFYPQRASLAHLSERLRDQRS